MPILFSENKFFLGKLDDEEKTFEIFMPAFECDDESAPEFLTLVFIISSLKSPD